jgi:hypothetical protein
LFKMAWGVLEDPRTPRPPGTVLLDDIKQLAMIDTSGPQFAHLKKDGHVILQPQPSDSVNDPLNWSKKRKMIVIFTLILSGITVGGMMAMLGPAGRQLTEKYGITYPVSLCDSQLTHLINARKGTHRYADSTSSCN